MSYPFRITPATLDVLTVLLSGQDKLYGLKIAREIGRATGSVAPILMRLENCGWVQSRWEDSSKEDRGPRRRFYELDPEVLGAARALVQSRRVQPHAPSRALRPTLGEA
ncbi:MULTISPECIES: helix-turn-helix transcriptional regulator [unclassified Glycomyces]|uniref:PadR family transcriptional regulator n=1 Tax=Glycomyces sp. NRRL B-16210 TaxID=1463821 RepID=UPI0009DCDD1F